MTHSSPETCLYAAADALGPLKVAGHAIRPDLEPAEAARWLANCLDSRHRQRLNYSQERLLFRLACEAGEHEGFREYALSVGYRIEPVDKEGELLGMARRAAAMAERAGELSAEVTARMQAAGIKVEE